MLFLFTYPSREIHSRAELPGPEEVIRRGLTYVGGGFLKERKNACPGAAITWYRGKELP